MINTFGVISKETAEAMAAAVARLTGAHMGIATTGVAGPSGGTEENPVGTVWIAIWYKGKIHSKRWQLGEQRSRVIERASLTGLIEAYRILNTHYT
jgi:nicotinamide-nucleotide amidase